MLLVSALLLIAAPLSLHAQSDALAWPEATNETRPWTRWWWLGSAVDSANLSANLETLSAASFGGVEVTSIYGVHGYEDAFVPYLSDRWVDLLLHTAAEAERLDMGVDMPPGSGWRAGGPGTPLEDASASLHLESANLRGGEVWEEDVSDRRVEAVIAVSSTGERVDLTERAQGAERARWQAPDGDWTLYLAETRFSGDSVKRPAPGGEGYAIDVLSSAAVRNFFDDYGARIERIPSGTLRSIFHDSYEYEGTGSAELFEAFRRQRGYGLSEVLPALMGDSDPETVARVKSDYRETFGEMLLAHFLQPLTEWSHARGSLSRNQAHGSPGNLLDLYAASDIPETEIFGPLAEEGADPLISKFASSAAHVAGKPLTSAESMTWLGEHFTVTLDQVKEAADQLFLSGVNHLIYHGTAYSPAEAEWPGWLFYASTQFNPRNASWRDLPALNAYVTRVQSVLQAGQPDNDLLLYWPIHDSWHDPEGLRLAFRIHNTSDWFYDKPIGETATTLWQAGYGFDYVSDRLLAEQVSASSDGIRAGDASYRAIVVPNAQHMPHGTFSTLLELAEAGATVAFLGATPSDVPGLGDLESRRAALAEAKARLSFGAPFAQGVREARLGDGRVLTGDRIQALLDAAGVPRESMADHGVQLIRRRHTDGHHYFVRNADEEPLDAWVPLAVDAQAVVIMDPLDGRTGVARSRSGSDGGTEVYLQLEPGESRILRSLDHATDGEPWPYHDPTTPAAPIEGVWQVEFIDGGPELPASYSTESLASWTESGDEAARFAGTARYTIRFDAPAEADDYLLDLGHVAESARVRVNGRELGTRFTRPFRVQTGPLQETGNELEIEVTNLSANRIRDLDVHGVEWKIFHDINFVGIDYQPFDASDWPIRPSGLLGPVTLRPLGAAENADRSQSEAQDADGPTVSLRPIGQGWAQTSVNAVVFRQNSVTTHGDTQYAGYYDADGHLVLAKRRHGTTDWEVHRTGHAADVRDAHNAISIAVDGSGLLHAAWGHHNGPLTYARAQAPGDLDVGKPRPMMGELEEEVTYPQFYNLPGGDLLFLYRAGGSGRGNVLLNRYDAKSGEWRAVQHPLLDGEGDRNAYVNTLAIDAEGGWHVSWTWRETPDVATNHDIAYAYSADEGRNWQRSSGEEYSLPITLETAEVVRHVPQNRELINQTSMTVDHDGRPIIATYWRPESSDVPQFHIVWHDGERWRTSQVGNRRLAFRLSGGGTKRIPISRPQVVADDDGAVYVIFRDEERGGGVSIAVSADPNLADWHVLDLDTQPVGQWEPTYDTVLWSRERRLHLFHQRVGQGDGETLEDVPPQTVSILEWEPGSRR